MALVFIALGMYAAKAIFTKNDKPPKGGTLVYSLCTECIKL